MGAGPEVGYRPTGRAPGRGTGPHQGAGPGRGADVSRWDRAARGGSSGDDDDGALGAAGEPSGDGAEDAADDPVRRAHDDGVGLVLPADLLQLMADVAAAFDQDPGDLGEVFRAGEFEPEDLGAVVGDVDEDGGSQPAQTVVGSRLATCTMIRPALERWAMPMA